jgi:hypothetical protein
MNYAHISRPCGPQTHNGQTLFKLFDSYNIGVERYSFNCMKIKLHNFIILMGILSFIRGKSEPGWVSSKELEVGKDYKYLAEYADRRRKGITSCRTLKRKVRSKSKGAKVHDFDMRFDADKNVRALFFVRTDKPIFKSCKRRKR